MAMTEAHASLANVLRRSAHLELRIVSRPDAAILGPGYHWYPLNVCNLPHFKLAIGEWFDAITLLATVSIKHRPLARGTRKVDVGVVVVPCRPTLHTINKSVRDLCDSNLA